MNVFRVTKYYNLVEICSEEIYALQRGIFPIFAKQKLDFIMPYNERRFV